MADGDYPPIFFVSYARADAASERDRDDLRTFIDDLSARVVRIVPKLVRELPGAPGWNWNSVRFFDASSIEAGEIWTTALVEGITKSRVGVALFTPSYFTRRWCGKEFQVLVNRMRDRQGTTGIVPVLWMTCTSLPPAVERFQYADDKYPPEYVEVGMQQLLKLKTVYADKYELALGAIAKRIAAAATAEVLVPLGQIDFGRVTSAWEHGAANQQSHREGSISKTCFVFVSREGWDWKPYAGDPRSIGAFAQQVSGELGLRYEELPCDAQLPRKLQETNQGRVPTVLFGDPSSLLDDHYSAPLREYDKQFLLNCAALVPWEPDSKAQGDSDPRWRHLRANVCPQKIESPPPYHEWRSIFSQQDLDARTRTTIEQIRSRLMKQLMSETATPGAAAVRKADNPQVTGAAGALGIDTASVAQLEGPSR